MVSYLQNVHISQDNKEILIYFVQEILLLLNFIIGSMIHFYLIFVYGTKYGSKLIERGRRAGDMAIQLLKSLTFSHQNAFVSTWKTN